MEDLLNQINQALAVKVDMKNLDGNGDWGLGMGIGEWGTMGLRTGEWGLMGNGRLGNNYYSIT